jgi:hypothetical protein
MTTIHIEEKARIENIVDYRGVFGLDIGFIDHFSTRLGSASNHSAIANLHN